jgi:hypothetical protein
MGRPSRVLLNDHGLDAPDARRGADQPRVAQPSAALPPAAEAMLTTVPQAMSISNSPSGQPFSVARYRHHGLLGHQVADALLVQRLGDDAQPQQVQGHHHGGGAGVRGDIAVHGCDFQVPGRGCRLAVAVKAQRSRAGVTGASSTTWGLALLRKATARGRGSVCAGFAACLSFCARRRPVHASQSVGRRRCRRLSPLSRFGPSGTPGAGPPPPRPPAPRPRWRQRRCRPPCPASSAAP